VIKEPGIYEVVFVSFPYQMPYKVQVCLNEEPVYVSEDQQQGLYRQHYKQVSLQCYLKIKEGQHASLTIRF
jgi:hypothetical protein